MVIWPLVVVLLAVGAHLAYVTMTMSHPVTPALPPNLPVSVDYATSVTSWPAFRNTHLGDCTFAAAGDLAYLWDETVFGGSAAPTQWVSGRIPE